jgi:hypothetical protein
MKILVFEGLPKLLLKLRKLNTVFVVQNALTLERLSFAHLVPRAVILKSRKCTEVNLNDL